MEIAAEVWIRSVRRYLRFWGLDRLRRDTSFALRGFRRTPAFAATVAVILGVGIGTSVAMFTVFRTVLVRKLPVVEQDRIAVMWTYRDNPQTEFAISAKALAEVRTVDPMEALRAE
jgi:hypothetical protein